MAVETVTPAVKGPQPAETFCLDNRLALRVEEAAALVGLSEGAFRAYLLPRCPKFYAGRSIRIPAGGFQAYVESLAQEELRQQTQTANSLLSRVEGDS